MSWLPDLPHLTRLLRRLQEGEDPLGDATVLFSLFCMKNQPPDEFEDRVCFLIGRHLRESLQGGGYIDTDAREIILRGPEKAVEIAVDRLDALCEMKRVPCMPDEVSEPEV